MFPFVYTPFILPCVPGVLCMRRHPWLADAI